jgi:uncharacterized membrane protein
MTIDDFALARAVHVLALVHWVGGVAAVTTIVLPRARRLPDAKDAVAAFETFERRFAQQVRVSILLVDQKKSPALLCVVVNQDRPRAARPIVSN